MIIAHEPYSDDSPPLCRDELFLQKDTKYTMLIKTPNELRCNICMHACMHTHKTETFSRG